MPDLWDTNPDHVFSSLIGRPSRPSAATTTTPTRWCSKITAAGFACPPTS
jgi:hypothetical protein